MVSHKTLSNWYLQLTEHLEAGSPLTEALKAAEGPPLKHRLRLAADIECGKPIHHVMDTAPSWLPKPDRAFISAAMETGRLPQTLRKLSDRHERIGANQFKLVMGLLYPLAVFHLAALVLPLVRMIDYENGFEWNAHLHALQSAAFILPLWALIGLVCFLAKTDNFLLPHLLRAIPLLRRYSKAQALADFSYTLATFIDAGVPIQSAWEDAVSVAHNSGFTRACRQLEPVFATGNDPAPLLKDFKCFPPDFVAFYTVGSQSGKLDQTLLKAGQQYQTRANHAMSLAAIAYPTLLFALVAAFIIFTIFQVYGSYLDVLNELAQ